MPVWVVSGWTQVQGMHGHYRSLQVVVQLCRAQIVGGLQVQPRLRIAAKQAA